MSAPGPSARGALHVYLGPVPGVGKTYRMLAEGRRRADLGVDVVLGSGKTHGRQDIGAIAQFVEGVTPGRLPECGFRRDGPLPSKKSPFERS
jgi:two-component system sensor histidine kinase KdpD